MSTLESRLADLIKSSGVSFRESSQSFIFECPRCQKRDKLYLRKANGRFICFHCAGDGFKGKPEYALRELLEIPLRRIQDILYGTQSPDQFDELVLEWEDHWEEEEFLFDLPAPITGICEPPDHYGPDDPCFAAARDYLVNERGISDDVISRYGIKWSPEEQRVIFPITFGDTFVGYQGRYIHATEYEDASGRTRRIPKAITTLDPACTGKAVIFEERLRGCRQAVITEGPLDALKCDQIPGGGNVATMGRAVTDAQLRLIGSYTHRIYLGLDPDAAQDITRILQTHGDDFETYLLQPPRGKKDLGDCSPEEVLAAFLVAPRLHRDSLVISLGSSLVFQ